ncbi:MAG TPA: ATP-binding protein, partial [Clostridiaceae bacterium]
MNGGNLMFIGRKRELDNLNQRYGCGKFECAIIYGWRGVGKTTLINEFIKDKEAISYTVIEGNEKENLEGLSKSIYSLSQGFSDASSNFSGFQEALETVFKIAQNRNKDTSKMFLILCGSSLSFMENQVLGYESPLFGRRTCQYKIMLFDFFEIKNYYNKFNDNDLAIIYGITGGIPLYMSLMNDNMSVEDNIKANFLVPNSYLFEEPTNVIKQECRDPSQYNSIIKAIATGPSRMSEISSKAGLDTSLA